MPANPQPRTYAMPERSDRLDFYVRDQTTRQPITEPHRHAYFQIQFNLGGDTEQRIGGVTRPFPRGALAFILPFREHLIPHPPGAHFIVINFSQTFLRADLDVDPLDLDEVPVQRVPELAPFRFQERLDYILTGDAFDDARRLAQRMLDTDRERGFGSATLLRGYLLQLIGLVSTLYAGALGRLAHSHGAQKAGRRDALARVMRHIRANLTSGELTLTGTAEAAFLSPNYLAHLIRKETGSTFTELVTGRRIALAQSLLAHTTRRIAEIAHEVGFRDEGYFSRRFRACVGMSPKDYREANGEAGAPRGESANVAGALSAASGAGMVAAGPALGDDAAGFAAGGEDAEAEAPAAADPVENGPPEAGGERQDNNSGTQRQVETAGESAGREPSRPPPRWRR